MNTLDLLGRLIAHRTLSRTPNMALLEEMRGLLEAAGARCTLVPYEEGRANLLASLGPEGPGGVMLSGHVDVVPVEGQDWTVPPWEMTLGDGRLYGRGTCDMKGFVACAVAAMLRAGPLSRPLHLALSCDEEVGCLGVRPLVEVLARGPKPDLCIVGEPTGMAVATGHKGKVGLRTTFRGREAHSALAPMGVNALHMAADVLGRLRAMQDELEEGAADAAYDVPYTTVHAGVLRGGTALNIVPNRAVMDWEIRFLAGTDVEGLLARLERDADAIATATDAPEALIRTERIMDYPGLDTPPDAEAARFVRSLTGSNETIKVAFGTEGGLFDAIGIQTVICGPGSMAQGHRPNEYVTEEQMTRCEAMLDRLLERLR